MGLNLFYTNNCPASFEPHGFTGCTDDNLYFPDGEGLITRTEKTSSLVAGAHRVGVVVSHVDSTEDEDGLEFIPEDINYSMKRSRLNEYKVLTKDTTIPTAISYSQPLTASFQQLPAPCMMASPAVLSTQTREDIKTKKALQQMQRSSLRPGELIPTQAFVSPDEDLDAEESNLPDQSYSNALRNYTQAGCRPARMVARSKIAELIIHVKEVHERFSHLGHTFDQDALKRYEIRRMVQPDRIKCECIGDLDQGTMVCDMHGSYPQDSANNRSFSVKSVAPGSTSLATVGTTSKKSIALMSISATAACFCPKRRT